MNVETKYEVKENGKEGSIVGYSIYVNNDSNEREYVETVYVDTSKLHDLYYLLDIHNRLQKYRVGPAIKELVEKALEHTSYADYQPDSIDNGVFEFIKDEKTGLYQMQLKKDFDIKRILGDGVLTESVTIEAGTAGGSIKYPWMLRDSWVAAGTNIEYPAALIKSTAEGCFNTRKPNVWAVVYASNVEDANTPQSLIIDSVVDNTYLKESVVVDCSLRRSNLRRLLATKEVLSANEVGNISSDFICATGKSSKSIAEFNGVGNESGCLYACRLLEEGVKLKRGCFVGSLSEFEEALYKRGRDLEETEMYYQTARYADFLVRSRVGKKEIEQAMHLLQLVFSHSHKAWSFYRVLEWIDTKVAGIRKY